MPNNFWKDAVSSTVAEVPFTVDADLDLGKAAAAWLRVAGADVVVRRGEVPETLAGVKAEGAAWQCVPGRVLVKPPSGMRFLVEGGDTIRYATDPGVDDVDVRLFLLGSTWGALMLQRDLLPLHASAVQVGEDVFGFTGDPGSGMSTLAAALAARGRGFFADDMLVLDPASVEPAPHCWGFGDLKLWPDSVAMTGAAAGQRIRTTGGLGKRYAVPFAQSPRMSGRLRKLYGLALGSTDTPCRIEKLAGRRSLRSLSDAVYGTRFAFAIVGRPRLLRWLAAVVRNVSVRRLEHPVEPSRFAAVVAHVDDDLLR